MVSLFLAGGFALLGASHAGAIELRPEMDALPQPGVPRLWESVPDADRVEPNLALAPPELHRWVFSPGDLVPIHVTCRPESAGDRVVLTVWDWHRNPVAQRTLAKPADETVQFAVSGRGTYLLTLDLFAEEQCAARLARSFSVSPSNLERRRVWAEDEFYVGTCAFPGRQHWRSEFGPPTPPGFTEQQSRALDAELAARLGLQIVRPDLPVEWAAEDAALDFARADASLGAWTSRGFRLALQIGQPPDWAVLPHYAGMTDPKWRYPRAEAPSRRWVAECTARYSGDAAFIELYNEPDNRDFWRGTPEEYLAWARWAEEEARRAAPDVPIANGGYCLIEPEWTGLFARALLGKTDLVAYHSHGGSQEIESTFAALRAVHAAAGYAKPTFINTEMGYAAWRLDVERSQAATAIQKLLYCWSHRHRGALLYCSRDIGGPRQRTGDADWGFIDYTMCPRFAYGALAAFIDTYAGARFDAVLAETQHLRAYLFRTEGALIASAYVPHDGSQRVGLTSDATRAELVDPMGNRTTLPSPQRVELEAGYYPLAVVFEGATTVRVE
ncbi:MAG: hypothetical protein FJX74_04915 [Armatimonadetes bacterium]|nr:hypothetical protein [Armatimonadota bacterium]